MPRILVADDNTNIQKMVALAFEERGVDVVAVGNGEAAVRRIPDADPDLVLADVFMPVRNGYEVCEFVKRDTRFAHVPVILLVGAFDPLDEKEARRVGADGVLKKPFVPPDPLIAMVMSALEKNPKVAAELTKASETPKEPPPPPVMETPAKAEPKPLPDFPEPSPEEAAAIYGFGKGVRSLEEEPEEERDRSPKEPAAKTKHEEEDEADFDGAATASDWHRTGGTDFDIPENTAVDPAYSYGKDLAPISFPSEKVVPPKRIRVRDEDLEKADKEAPPLAQQLASSKPAEPAQAEEVSHSFAPYGMRLSSESPDNDSAQDTPSSWHESSAFQSAVNSPAVADEESAAPSSFSSIRPLPTMPLSSQWSAPSQSDAPPSSSSQSSHPSTPSHSSTPWTDLTARPSEYPEGSWTTEMESTPAAKDSESELENVHESAASNPAWRAQPTAPSTPIADSSRPSTWQPHLESRKETENRIEPQAASTDSRARKKSWFADAIEVVREVVHGGSQSTDQPVSPERTQAESTTHAERAAERVADSSPELEAVVSTALVAQVRDEVPGQTSTTETHVELSSVSESKLFESMPEPEPETKQFEPQASEPEKHEPEFFSEPVAATPSHKDPAVPARVTPEPLLVRDETPATALYEDHDEPAASFQAFQLHEAEPANGESSMELPEEVREETSVFASASESLVSKAEEHLDFGERVPTLPPANRQALAGIPFLIPSPAVIKKVNTPQPPTEASQANVDEMVQKVLERLEPQLHELLSKNLLKPLVENMLQQELTRKDK